MVKNIVKIWNIKCEDFTINKFKLFEILSKYLSNVKIKPWITISYIKYWNHNITKIVYLVNKFDNNNIKLSKCDIICIYAFMCFIFL